MFDPESRMDPGVERDGAYFLDRDPNSFSIVLNYLRSGVLFGTYPTLDTLPVAVLRIRYVPVYPGSISENFLYPGSYIKREIQT
jgi:hypothetical protein